MAKLRATNTGQKTRPNFAELAGMPPQAYKGGLYDEGNSILPEPREGYFARPGPGSKGKRTSANRSASGFNLRGVVEVLTEFGLDPVAELGRALTEQVPVMHEGQPVMIERQAHDAIGRPRVKNGKPVMEMVPQTKHLLDIDTRVRVLQDLTQYVHPKLKATEVTIKKPELTEDQVEARLAQLLAKALGKT